MHITIPTPNPWVPLRILALGKQPADRIDADVYLLTDRTPTLLLGPRAELGLLHSARATDLLLTDLRADEGMAWVPQSAWLTKLRIDARAADLTYDLAVDASGSGTPSPVAAGLSVPAPVDPPPAWALLMVVVTLLGVPVALSVMRDRS